MAENASNRDPRDFVAVALDVPDLRSARPLLAGLGGRVGWFKIGLQLFTAEGTAAVRAVTDSGSKAFVDLKLHDIPNTVRGAVRSLSALGAGLCTIHASGGGKMIAAAAEEAKAAGTGMKIIAVTVLTSLDDAGVSEIGMGGGASGSVSRLLRLAVASGADGCVMSPIECGASRKTAPPGFFIVTPGIRALDDPAGDQARTSAPAEAIRAGSSLLVIGRPITGAPDPAARAEEIVSEIARALREAK